jgi:hypothetical protein
MTDKDDAMEAFLQQFEGRRDGSLVTGFVVLAELARPDQPGYTGYSYFTKGSPAHTIGLAEMLKDYMKGDTEDRRG